ncbi:hypothetical protein QWT69_04425 [Sporosarcina oncorhynchi]|uniref:DUF4265 domain-containing protein n=1 Tax=Sporosarcina oncorhynchi TaxID=3056444 RepID=A0ABZ0L9Z5_9BACL|nr:hypothetical protein [Sporosarcina sp. T2O-4]WOV88376.1 hypothetical protein QWT69_04425 [Sporosarcina sp. T2O-4]
MNVRNDGCNALEIGDELRVIDYFERKIRLKDFEVWKVRIGEYAYVLAIIDEYESNLVDDEDDFRENTVSCSYFSEQEVRDEYREPLGQFARQLTDHLALAHCQVNIEFFTTSPDQAITERMQKMYGYLESDIPLEKLWHFNQD